MEFNELVKSFADKYGVGDLEIVDGIAALSIDEMSFAIMYSMETDTVTLYGEIGEEPPEANGPFGKTMLRANYLLAGTDGAILCQNPDNEAYAMFRRIPLSQLDPESLAAAVEKHVNQTADWRLLIQGFRAAEDAAEDHADQDGDFSPLGSGSFMQV